MPLDPSIYSNVGRVNLAAGLSDILDQQRQREAMNEERQLRLSTLAQQQETLKQAQTQKRNQELNMWLSSAVQSGRPLEEVMPEAIAKGAEIGVAPEITQRHVTNVYGAVTPQARSDVAFTQAYPELVAKQRAESMFAKPSSQASPETITLLKSAGIEPSSKEGQAIIRQKLMPERPEKLVAVFGAGGNPVLVPSSQAVGMQPFSPQAAKTAVTEQAKAAQNEQAALSAQQALDQANKLLQHPGRKMATGASSFMGNIPGTEARGFTANLETFKAQVFLPMVSALKGMGALSDAEGKKISASVGALDPSMPEKEFEQSLKDSMKFLYDKAKAAGLNVANPLETASDGWSDL